MNGAAQKVVPSSFQTRLFCHLHYSPSAGYPGERRMYYSMRGENYGLHMEKDVYTTVRNCQECARDKPVNNRRCPLQLLLANGQLNLSECKSWGHSHDVGWQPVVQVMTDRHSKFTRAVSTSQKTERELHMASPATDIWVKQYGIPTHVLADNGMQLSIKLLSHYATA